MLLLSLLAERMLDLVNCDDRQKAHEEQKARKEETEATKENAYLDQRWYVMRP